MKQIILLLCLILMRNTAAADPYCFVVKENGKVLKQEGNECDKRFPPQSTFKIALSLMGFDSGILKDENKPIWLCKDDYDYYINVCKGPHTPRTWMRDSCLWYSRVMTKELGIEKFKIYVEDFNYGNNEVKGDDALMSAWISSSLRISPLEQITFLQDIIDHNLPVTDYAYDKTKKIMFIQELAGGWKLYGKTGNGKQLQNDNRQTDFQHGWFIGYIEKNDRRITFASHLSDDKKYDTFASFRIKNEVITKLWYLIDELEN